jgi:hypothetical protein
MTFPAQLTVGFCIQDERRQIEFFLKFVRPLLAYGGGAYDDQAALSLRPLLAENNSRFDGFA